MYSLYQENAPLNSNRPTDDLPGTDTLNLTSFLLGPNRYVLRIQGDAMVEAGILNGDMAVVEQGERTKDGDIVVALIDSGETTLGRLQRHTDGTITLHPANATMTARRYNAGRVAIQGRLVGQMRCYR